MQKAPARPRHRKELYNKLALRDGGPFCFYCTVMLENQITSRRMTLDHVVPLSRGGLNDMENLVLACSACNTHKGSMTVDEYLDSRYLKERRQTVSGHVSAHKHQALLYTRRGHWSCLCGAYGTHAEHPHDKLCLLPEKGHNDWYRILS